VITRRKLLAGLAGAAAGAVGLAGYAFGIEPQWRLSITRYRIKPANWPRDYPVRIVVLSDIHACEPFMSVARIGDIVRVANGLGGDLIALLGDFTTGHRFVRRILADEEWAAPLAGLKAPLGVHAVLGNHDWWSDHRAQRTHKAPIAARRALEARGIPVYENDAVRIAHKGRSFWLAGLADQLAIILGRGRHKGFHDLPATLARIDDDAPIVLLAHEPDIFTQVPDRVGLTISGHTHGGQVRLLGYSPVVPSRYGNRFAYGHIVEGGRDLVVSGGLGCSIMPVRFGVPPEIVVIDLA